MPSHWPRAMAEINPALVKRVHHRDQELAVKIFGGADAPQQCGQFTVHTQASAYLST